MSLRICPQGGGYYAVSDTGLFFRVYTWTGAACMRPIKPTLDQHGYLRIGLRVNRAPQRRYLTHRLVCAAFHGPALGRVVNHKNGIKTDNSATNLEWVSASQNRIHALATGLATVSRGSSCHSARLIEADIILVRHLHANGWYCKTIAAVFEIAPTAIEKIIRGQNWRHVA